MSADDALEATPPPDRVYYATGVLLAAEDFIAEQTYHRSRLARALSSLQGCGTIAGLKVEHAPAADGREEQIVVQPGIALDRVGRLIEIPRRYCIRLERWYQTQPVDTLVQALHPRTPAVADDPYAGVVVDVFVRFVACERGKTPAFAAGDFDALDAVAPARIRDGFELTLVARPEDHPPLPHDPLSELTGIAAADRLRATQDRIFALWSQQVARPDDPLAPHEYLLGQDRTSVFLARLEIPAAAAAAAGQAPTRTAGDVAVHNYDRLFVYPTAMVAKGAGL